MTLDLSQKILCSLVIYIFNYYIFSPTFFNYCIPSYYKNSACLLTLKKKLILLIIIIIVFFFFFGSINVSRVTFSQSPSQLLETKPIISNSKEEQDKLFCCPQCTSSYEKEAQLLKSGQQKNLPPWLHPQGTNANQEVNPLGLRRIYLCLSS